MNDIWSPGDPVELYRQFSAWLVAGEVVHCDATGGVLIRYQDERENRARCDWFSAATLVRDSDRPSDRAALRFRRAAARQEVA